MPCFHISFQGFIRGMKILRTEDIPYLSPSEITECTFGTSNNNASGSNSSSSNHSYYASTAAENSRLHGDASFMSLSNNDNSYSISNGHHSSVPTIGGGSTNSSSRDIFPSQCKEKSNMLIYSAYHIPDTGSGSGSGSFPNSRLATLHNGGETAVVGAGTLAKINPKSGGSGSRRPSGTGTSRSSSGAGSGSAGAGSQRTFRSDQHGATFAPAEGRGQPMFDPKVSVPKEIERQIIIFNSIRLLQ
jgi:hypothetical protein